MEEMEVIECVSQQGNDGDLLEEKLAETPHSQGEETAESRPLSKKQRKRLERQEMFKAKKKLKKEQQRAAKAVKSSVVSEKLPTPQKLPPIELPPGTTWTQLRKAATKEAFESLCSRNFHVLIDCAWEAYHPEHTLCSLTQQIMHCYGISRRHTHPAFIRVFNAGERTIANLQKVNHQNWLGFQCHSVDYLSCNDYSLEAQEGKKQLVYLTSDAEEIITELSPDCAYIIGGIVDRNRLKGATYSKALQQGVRCVKLPIKQHFDLSSTHVLAVNHVFTILLNFCQTKDWRLSIEAVLPKRKEPKPKVANDTLLTDAFEESGNTQEERDDPQDSLTTDLHPIPSEG